MKLLANYLTSQLHEKVKSLSFGVPGRMPQAAHCKDDGVTRIWVEPISLKRFILLTWLFFDTQYRSNCDQDVLYTAALLLPGNGRLRALLSPRQFPTLGPD